MKLRVSQGTQASQSLFNGDLFAFNQREREREREILKK
jgi:hypothetical protein